MNAHAFEELFREHSGKVLDQAMRLVRDQMEAEDVAAEVWLRVWRGMGEFEGRSSVSTWLFTITMHAAIDRRRARGRRAGDFLYEDEALLEGAPEAFIGPERAFEQGELHRSLHAVFDRLEPECREVLGLWLEDLSYQQIAEETKSPLGTVKTRIHRARGLMAALLEELGCALPVRAKRPVRQAPSNPW